MSKILIYSSMVDLIAGCLHLQLSTPTFNTSPYNVLCTLLCPPTLHNMFDTWVHGERKHESLDFKDKLKYLYLFSGMCKKCGNVFFVNKYHVMKVNNRHSNKSLYAVTLEPNSDVWSMKIASCTDLMTMSWFLTFHFGRFILKYAK